jgi:glyoxylase-like metal-dependent hydrolase (beta-lactamase superfamily II)
MTAATMTDALKFKTDMHFAYGVPAPMGTGVIRLVARNASPLTFKGTNTYLLGEKSLAVIDPGPDDPEHLRDILKAAGRRPITHILATHAHRDHVDGVEALKAATGAETYGYRRPLAAADATAPASSEYINEAFRPDVALTGGERMAGEDWALVALHTPGHTSDHLCFAVEDRGVVFSGDHVMAWNTSVVAPPEGRMSDYMRSLELLLERSDEVLLPGHGGRVTEPRRTVKAYLLHRRWREQAILDAVKKGADTARKLLPVIYRDIDADVAGAATLSLLAHLEHLKERGLINTDDVLDVDSVAAPV